MVPGLSGNTGRVAESIVLGLVLVDRWFWRVWLRCPLCIAMDVGAYCRTSWEVSSGHVVKWPASIAWHQVERAGEKLQAW